MTFQLIIGLMFLLALALALYPLIKPAKQKSNLTHRQAQLDIYAQRVKELETELDAGDIKQADFDLALTDLEREIVESGGLADEQEKSILGQFEKSWFALIAGLLTPVLALFLYFNFAGTPRAADPDFQQRNQAMAANSSDVISQEQILQMIESLENYLQEVPEDTEKWVLLARTYAHAQKYPEAAQAYAQAFDNGLTYDPNMLASYADILAYVQGSSFIGRPTELINLALELDPSHGMSLWLAGTAAYAREDWPQAETYWRTLLSLLPPDAKEVEILQQSLEEVAIRKSGHK